MDRLEEIAPALKCLATTEKKSAAGLRVKYWLNKVKGASLKACPLLFSLGPKAMVAAFLHLLATYQPDCYNL